MVEAERETPAEEEIDRGKAALTELFEEAKNGDTPIIVERIVDDIDEIVRPCASTAGRHTHAGEREVKKALRQDAVQVQAAPGRRAVRPGLRLHPGVLLMRHDTWPSDDSTQLTAPRAAELRRTHIQRGREEIGTPVRRCAEQETIADERRYCPARKSNNDKARLI